jgi:nucleoside-diphosphate-sugar epimerase
MGDLSFERAVIFGAGGPTGFFLASELRRRGVSIRAAARDRDRLARTFADEDVDTVSADATDADQVARSIAGCDLVVDCIGLPAEHMADHPRTASAIAEAVQASGARCLQVSSFWSYLPITRLPLDESHPRRGGVDYVRYRRQAEDILQAVGACVVQLPDFYGPRVHTSTLQQPLMDAVAGKPMSWIGRADTAREYAFVPDAMATVAALACRPEAYGERWIVPGAGPLTGAETAVAARHHLGQEVKLRAAGVWTLRLASLFIKPLRQFMPMIPYYVEPVSYDGSRLEALLGEQDLTPYPEGIAITLDWIRRTG